MNPMDVKPIKPEPVGSKVAPDGRLLRVHKEISQGVEDFSPKVAAEIIERQTENRPLSQRRVDDIARQIREGRWMVNGETIIFDWFDRLIDGQHRLWACIEADKTIRSHVVRGVDPASFVTIDTGRTRDAKDLLAIRGEANAIVLSGVLRLIWRWEMFEKFKPILFSRKSVRKTSEVDESPIGKRWTTQHTASPRELEEILTRHPDCRRWVKKVSAQRICPQAALAFACYWIASNGAKVDEIESFIYFVSEGANMPTTDPLYRVHKRFRDQKMAKSKGRRAVDPIEAVALLVKAWNYSRAGQKIENIVWRTDEDMPEPVK